MRQHMCFVVTAVAYTTLNKLNRSLEHVDGSQITRLKLQKSFSDLVVASNNMF